MGAGWHLLAGYHKCFELLYCGHKFRHTVTFPLFYKVIIFQIKKKSILKPQRWFLVKLVQKCIVCTRSRSVKSSQASKRILYTQYWTQSSSFINAQFSHVAVANPGFLSRRRGHAVCSLIAAAWGRVQWEGCHLPVEEFLKILVHLNAIWC